MVVKVWAEKNAIFPKLPIGEAEEKCSRRGRKKSTASKQTQVNFVFFFSFHHLRIQLIQITLSFPSNHNSLSYN
ncbi:hypothetical protein VNO80_28632 [Phaseolus coccineus]|uniref:Uncharacterized protein n=1 Tax=Phaseolus coccineus TaxID=3886 RepID=A0AAN9L9X5_PHACN